MTETPLIDKPYVDPDHLLPDEEWGAVVRRANAIAEETRANAGGGAASGIAPIFDMTAQGITSRKYFGVSGIPTQLLVLHSAECPLRGGFAQSLTEWAATVYPQSPIASWQRFVDPFVRLRFIPDELGAWHASEANVNSIGWEQAGYARFSRAEWLTPDGRTQMESLAFDMAEVAIRDGIPARWLTDAEVVAATHGGNRSVKGFCTHRQIDPDTRTDPGNGYPYDLLMERIKFYMTNGAPDPEPTPTEEKEDTDMLTIYRDTSAPDPDKTWIGNALFKRHVPSPQVLAEYQLMASEGKMDIAKGGAVQILPDRLFGRDIDTLVTK